MVQTKIVGSTLSCLWLPSADHARAPVMLPHKSDSKVRRNGSNAASMQLQHPVAERGRVHGVPDLASFRPDHAPAWRRARSAAIERKRRWRILHTTNDQLRGRDKSAQGAHPSVGCFCSEILAIRQGVSLERKVHRPINALQRFRFLHIAETGDG